MAYTDVAYEECDRFYVRGVPVFCRIQQLHYDHKHALAYEGWIPPSGITGKSIQSIESVWFDTHEGTDVPHRVNILWYCGGIRENCHCRITRTVHTTHFNAHYLIRLFMEQQRHAVSSVEDITGCLHAISSLAAATLEGSVSCNTHIEY